MLSTNAKTTEVFCDWLDVTTPPHEEYRLRSELGALLVHAGAEKVTEDLYRLNNGSFKFVSNSKWFKLSFSGSVVAVLRFNGQWEHALSLIGEGPHRVTRVDAAVDIALDGADSIAMLQAAYPSGQVRLSQRPVSISELLSTRADGRKTGTWYAGHRGKSEITCRVYDKAKEALDKRGELMPPRTRCELTVCKGAGPTLRDAAEPTRIFWHYMAPAVLPRPDGVPAWDSGWAEGWVMDRVDLLPAQALKRRIEHSAELAALIELADSIGAGGRQYALRLIREKFDQAPQLGSPPELDASLVSEGLKGRALG